MMKFNLYLEANVYAENGWTIELVRVDSDHYDYKATKEDTVFIQQIELPEPTSEQLKTISEPAIAKMEEQIIRAKAEAEARLNEFKSKFLLLESN